MNKLSQIDRYSVVSRLANLSVELDKLLGSIKAHYLSRDFESIPSIVDRLNELIDELRPLADAGREFLRVDEHSDEAWRYLNAYYRSLKLVTLPYIGELLTRFLEECRNSEQCLHGDKLEEVIQRVSSLLSTL